MVVEGYQEVCPLAGADYRYVEDNLWMVQSGVLVLSMNAAFGLLEAGSVRTRNVLNIMMKNISDMTLGGVSWWVVGYTLSFQVGDDEKFPHSIYDENFWFFQWTFAATAATIDSGTIAERVNYLSYVLLSINTTALIYPVCISWVWASEGYLVAQGFCDYAGGAAVHMLGACSAMVCALLVGPRVGRFADYEPRCIWAIKAFCKRSYEADYYIMPAGQRQIIAVTDPVSLVWGVFFLWIGWYGFNPGGVWDIEFGGAYVMGRVVANTTLGALAGGFTNFCMMMYFNWGKAYAEGFALGVLAGLVCITAGCLYINNADAWILGMVGAFLGEGVRRLLAWAWIDDVVTAIPVHGAPGGIGAIAIALFAQPWGCSDDSTCGIFYCKGDEQCTESWRLLKVQIWGCFLIAVWASGATFLTIFFINLVPDRFYLNLRLNRGDELKGLDEVEHDMTHEREDFQDVVKHFFASLSKHNNNDYEVRIKEAAAEALKCLSFQHCMQEFAHSRVHRKCDLTLIIKEISIKGLNDAEIKPGCLGSCSSKNMHLIVEVVSAIRLENCFQRDYNYFAPRFAHMGAVDVAAREAKFEGEFVFEDFYVPPGSEESTYICLTLGVADVIAGQVHLPFMGAGWKNITDDAAGLEAYPTGEVAFLNKATQAGHKEPVIAKAHFLCPVAAGGRRGSQINRVVAEDLKVKGSLHHSGQLTDAELDRRIMMDPEKEGRNAGSTMARLMNETSGAAPGGDDDSTVISQLETDIKAIKEAIAVVEKSKGAA